MAGGGRVEHDEVGVAAPLELLHLAEDEDVLDAGGGGGHDVEGAGGHEPLRDPRQPVVAEVVEQGLVGGQRAGPHLALAGRSPARRQHGLVVVERLLAEHRGQARLALHLDDEGGQPDPSGGPGDRGGDHRFADAALPGHDEQPRCSEEATRIHDR